MTSGIRTLILLFLLCMECPVVFVLSICWLRSRRNRQKLSDEMEALLKQQRTDPDAEHTVALNAVRRQLEHEERKTDRSGFWAVIAGFITLLAVFAVWMTTVTTVV